MIARLVERWRTFRSTELAALTAYADRIERLAA